MNDNIMVMHTNVSANGETSFTEQDGDVSFNESGLGQWQLRMTGCEQREFDSHAELMDAIYREFPELEGITVYK